MFEALECWRSTVTSPKIPIIIKSDNTALLSGSKSKSKSLLNIGVATSPQFPRALSARARIHFEIAQILVHSEVKDGFKCQECVQKLGGFSETKAEFRS